MTQKQISKDNRIYWNNKIENKFDEKKQDIESMFINEINDKSEKQYPKFIKILGMEKHLKKLVEVQKDYNDFILSNDKKKNDLLQKVSKTYAEIEKKFNQWERSRKWENRCPSMEFSDIDGTCSMDQKLEEKLKENCHKEVEKAFYASPKAKVLKTLQNICKQSNIAISIPTEKTLKITQGGE